MQHDSRREQAHKWRERAYDAQMHGDVDGAIKLYIRSIEICPTAEAHTFLGWAYSFQERYDEAIDECHRAIAIDPDFGNPYNDIGAYLMHLERFEEAIHWLEQACNAPRYDARHFAYFNLGRVRERFGDYFDALRAYDRAGELEPRYAPPLHAAERLRAWMN